MDQNEQAYYSYYNPAELDKGAVSWDWYCLADPKVLWIFASFNGAGTGLGPEVFPKRRRKVDRV